MAPPPLQPEWATDEPPELLFLERVIHAAVNMGAVAFGIHVAIFAICTYQFTKAKKFPYLQQLYITTIFLLALVTITCNIRHNQLSWIDNRNYPGGPLGFILEQQPNVVNTVGNSAGLILAFMVDSLLIYRCYVVWNSNYYVIILPILTLIASTVMACFQTIAASEPMGSLWAERAVLYGLPYFCLSMSVNMLVTAIIITRLLLARRSIQSVMGKDHGKEYTGVAAMLIESALPPALVSAVLIALYAQANTAQILFFPLLPQVQAMAPQLIFIRVMRGRGWSKDTMSRRGQTVTEVEFNSNPVLSSNKGSTTIGSVAWRSEHSHLEKDDSTIHLSTRV
ncbi:hypothetical protein H1R20_g12085, partial [Candolleomyces eurysporus]